MYKFKKSIDDHISIKSWFGKWEEFVVGCNFKSARDLFEEEVVSFGTWMNVVQGLDELELKQWKNIWPTIKGFKFLTETLFIQMSPDKLFANSILTWESLGFDEKGTSFYRTGRASVVLKRIDIYNDWKGIHTHFSLNRNIPQKSFGKFKKI